MAHSINSIQLLGNLGKDAETKFTPSGASVTTFSVATSRSWKEKDSDEWKEATTWTNVVAWRKESIANYLTKGSRVFVQGRIETRSYENKEGQKVYVTEVIADQVIPLGSARGELRTEEGIKSASAARAGASSGSRKTGEPQGKQHPSEANWPMGITDNDIPW